MRKHGSICYQNTTNCEPCVFVARRWTRSMASMAFFSLGLQIVFPYSRIGLTLYLKRSAKISLSINLNVRLIIPITWLAFFTVLLMCSLKVNRLSMVTPRSFLAVVFLSSVVWPSLVFIEYMCVLDFVVLFSWSWTCLGGISASISATMRPVCWCLVVGICDRRRRMSLFGIA